MPESLDNLWAVCKVSFACAIAILFIGVGLCDWNPEAIATWMFRQRPNPEQAIKHLEDAALELHRASKN